MIGGCYFRYLQIDGGHSEPRVPRNPPTAKGHLTFTPSTNDPYYYVVGVDPLGYETLLAVFDNNPEAWQAAEAGIEETGATMIVDITSIPVVSKVFTPPGGVAYVKLEGGTDAPRVTKSTGIAWKPEGPCWYAFVVFEDGEEFPAYVGYDEEDARQHAAEAVEKYQAPHFIDMTAMGTA